MPPRALVAGIDVGGTKILGQVIDPAHPLERISTARVDTPRGGDAIVDAINQVYTTLDSAATERGKGLVQAIGIGAAGQVDLRGVVRYAPNLPGVVECDLASPVAQRTHLPVVVDNDANCAMLAEWRVGAAVGATNAALVTLGTGIGCGLIVDGRLVRGAAGFAGEPGHAMIDPNGPPCPCGRHGCWERYASGSGLGRLARDAAAAGQADRVVALAGGDAENVRGEHVTRAALEGDPDSLEVMRKFAWWVAVGVANLVNVLDPEIVVIGGGLAEAGDTLLVPTREAYEGLVLAADHRPPVRIVAAALGADAGAIGAGLSAETLLK